MNAGGKKEVLYEGVNVGEKDYSAIVSKIKAAGADYLMWGGMHTEGGLIVRQMRDQDMKTILISGDGITDAEFASIGGPGVEGTLMSFGPEPRNNPAAKDVVAEFKAKGFEPEGYTLYSYAGMQIIKQAIEKANSTDPKKVADVMHSGMTFKTVTTPRATERRWTSFGTSGQRTRTASSPTTRCDSNPPARGLGPRHRSPPRSGGLLSWRRMSAARPQRRRCLSG
jgi:branched-chain amino acid transport system substrate-binding protein